MKYVNKSLERAISLINLFDNRSVKMTATEIAEELGSSPGSLYPIIHTLIRHGYLHKDGNKKYSLGLSFLEKGHLILETKELRLVVRPHLEKLAEEFNSNAHLAVLRDDEVFYLDRATGSSHVSIQNIVGSRSPAYGTALGKVLLASLTQEELEDYFAENELFPLTDNTITDRDILVDHLEEVRRDGFALDEEEYLDGASCVATPIQDFNDDLLAAISVATHDLTGFDNLKDRLVSSLKKKSLTITEELG